MKKILTFILIPYLLLIGIVFYLYFGPGLLGTFEPLKWQGLTMQGPKNFHLKIYNSKGWEVYSLRKLDTLIKIAIKESFDVSSLTRFSNPIAFQFSPSPEQIFFVSNPGKRCEMVYACRIEEVALYFSVASASPYSCRSIMGKLLASCYYNGRRISLPPVSLPLKVYANDFLFVVGMTLPLFIILIIFNFSGKKPAESRFVEDPIRCGESHVYYSAQRKYRRRNSFCYLALTSTRLMIFQFMRPIWECRIYEHSLDLRIEGKKIIIQTEKDKLILKPSDIDRWKNCLSEFLMRTDDTDEKRR